MSSTTQTQGAQSLPAVTHDELEAFLAAVVARKGAGAEARPGQVALAHDVLDAFNARRTMSGVAPPGTGKSFAYLSVAALLATRGQRTLVSTEMLGLQRQLIAEDLPEVAAALLEHTGASLSFASFMGVSNYVDPGRLLALASGLTRGAWKPASSSRLSLGDVADAHAELSESFDEAFSPRGVSFPVSTAPVLRDLVLAGLEAHLVGEAGDRTQISALVPAATPDDWSLVSAGADERTAARNLTGMVHKYDEARAKALEASIVVANHALLGIEAVSLGGAVFETAKSGSFDHVVVDEAHALPAGIRGAGDGKVSGAAFRDVGARARRLLNDFDVNSDATDYAKRLDAAISAAIRDGGDRGVLTIDPPSRGILSSDMVEEGQGLLAYASDLFSERAGDDSASLEYRTQARKAQATVDRLRTSMSVCHRPQDESSGTFVARWAESWNGKPALRYTPIPVDGLATISLWHKPGDGRARGVACVSATLPHGFGAQLAVAEPVRYQSPFAEALAGSAVYIPAVTDPGAEGLLNASGRFDTGAHAVWASRHVVELVRANDGRALVVSATNAGAAVYAEALTQALAGTGIAVHTQASGREQALAAFRADERSVLVGTRSYMTGIDVAGESLSLVVLDRPPRAAGNVVDDARVALVARAKGVTRFDASLDVYVADAASLLDQARGRLIRSQGDRGMVAVLDPRINGLWPLRTPSLTEKQVYFEPLAEFGTRIPDLAGARSWLENRREAADLRRQIAELEASTPA